jgi:hypothetical protein
MQYRGLAFLVALVLAGCTTARPLEPLEPLYPQMMSSTAIEGAVAARVEVGRGGEVRSVRVHALDGTHELFTASLRRDLEPLRFRPARVLGIARASTMAYTVRYVLVTDAGSPCPQARAEREIIVCSVFSNDARERTY